MQSYTYNALLLLLQLAQIRPEGPDTALRGRTAPGYQVSLKNERLFILVTIKRGAKYEPPMHDLITEGDSNILGQIHLTNTSMHVTGNIYTLSA